MNQRGISLSYGAKVALPDNFIFTGTKFEKRDQFFQAYPESISKIVSDLKSRVVNSENYQKRFRPTIPKITKKAYQLFYNVKKKQIDHDRCVDCKTCVKVCPVNNIRESSGRYTINKNCEDCMACIQWCPKKAVVCGKKVPEGRTEYKHPEISVKEIFSQKSV